MEPSYDSLNHPCISSTGVTPQRFEYFISIKFSEVYHRLSFRSFYWEEKDMAHSLALP